MDQRACTFRLLVTGLALVTIACGSDTTVSPGTGDRVALSQQIPGGDDGGVEEELFGELSGIMFSGSAALFRSDGVPLSSVPINTLGTLAEGGHDNAGAHFGWYDNHDGICQGSERHREPGLSTFPETTESHCLGERSVILVLGGHATTTRPLDFIRYSSGEDLPGDSQGELQLNQLQIESPGGQQLRDLFTRYSGTVSTQLQPIVEISPKAAQFQYSNRWDPRIPDGPGDTIHVPQNFVVRVGAWKGPGTIDSETLVRYFWDFDGDPADRSGFVNAIMGGLRHIRKKVYAAPGPKTLVAHLIQPGHRPASGYTAADVSYGETVTLQLYIDAPLTADISADPGQAFVDSVIEFTAGGDSGGGGNSYRWEFGDGTFEDFPGSATVQHSYSETGQMTVVLMKRDQYGYEAADSMTVSITQPPPPFGISVYADHDDQQNIVRANQTCRWRAGPYNGATYQWYKFVGVWKLQSSSNPFSLGVGPAGTTWNLRVIGTAPDAAKDTVHFTVNVTSGGSLCGPW